MVFALPYGYPTKRCFYWRCWTQCPMLCINYPYISYGSQTKYQSDYCFFQTTIIFTINAVLWLQFMTEIMPNNILKISGIFRWSGVWKECRCWWWSIQAFVVCHGWVWLMYQAFRPPLLCCWIHSLCSSWHFILSVVAFKGHGLWRSVLNENSFFTSSLYGTLS